MKKKGIELTAEATKWSESFLLGNGAMGAAVYGGVFQEKIDLSELTFFSGEIGNHHQEGAAEAFASMRKWVMKQDYEQAEKAAKQFIGLRKNYGTNLPAGILELKLTNLDQDSYTIAEYARKLDYMEGICSCESLLVASENLARSSNPSNSIQIKREAFVSHSDPGLYYCVESTQPLDFLIRYRSELTPYTIEFEKLPSPSAYQFHTKAQEAIHCDEAVGVELRGTISIFEGDGEVCYEAKGIRISRATRFVMKVALHSDFDLQEKGFRGKKEFSLKVLQERSYHEIKESSYQEIKERHIQDISAYMKRVDLNLFGADELSEKMLQYGRYLLLSSSREDSKLPAHLQGVFNDQVACRIGWSCDMHLDINIQMNYWLSEAGNLAECHEPLFQWMEKALIPSGRRSASENYGLSGWCADLVSNAWGYSAPYWSETISPCPTGGIWMASDFWEHYLYHEEEEFLRKRVFPVLQEAVEFFIDYVFQVGETYHSGPSISPENSFIHEGKRHYFSLSPTYEILMIRELFLQYEGMMERLSMDSCMDSYIEDRKRCKEILEKLPKYKLNREKEIQEYNEEVELFDPWHRHTSHLLGLYPYHQISVDTTPELAEGAYRTLSKKLSPYEQWEDTGWARSMLILYMARLRKGDEALWHLKEMYRKLTSKNLLVMHPPTRGAPSFQEVYELDGNTGASMGIIEMLLQSQVDDLYLLPALPKAWPKGSIKGLKARGNILVDIYWENRALSRIELEASKDKRVRINYDFDEKHWQQTQFIDLEKNQKVIIDVTREVTA